MENQVTKLSATEKTTTKIMLLHRKISTTTKNLLQSNEYCKLEFQTRKKKLLMLFFFILFYTEKKKQKKKLMTKSTIVDGVNQT